MSKQITETTPVLDKGKLLETAKAGGAKQTVRKDVVEDLKALVEVRSLKKQCEAQETALVARLGTVLIEMGVALLTTPEGVVQAVPAKRTDIDRSLLTPDQVKELSKVTEFVKLEARSALPNG